MYVLRELGLPLPLATTTKLTLAQSASYWRTESSDRPTDRPTDRQATERASERASDGVSKTVWENTTQCEHARRHAMEKRIELEKRGRKPEKVRIVSHAAPKARGVHALTHARIMRACLLASCSLACLRACLSVCLPACLHALKQAQLHTLRRFSGSASLRDDESSTSGVLDKPRQMPSPSLPVAEHLPFPI